MPCMINGPIKLHKPQQIPCKQHVELASFLPDIALITWRGMLTPALFKYNYVHAQTVQSVTD